MLVLKVRATKAATMATQPALWQGQQQRGREKRIRMNDYIVETACQLL